MTMTTPAGAVRALQAAIVTRLRATYAVTHLLGDQPAVYDAVPQDARFPRIVLEEPDAAPDRTFGQDGSQCLLNLVVQTQDASPTAARSGAAGFKLALEIAEEAMKAIGIGYPPADDFTPLAIDGWDLVDIDVTDVSASKLADGITREVDLLVITSLEAQA